MEMMADTIKEVESSFKKKYKNIHINIRYIINVSQTLYTPITTAWSLS